MSTIIEGTIDFSPNPRAGDLTIQLTDENLQYASHHQIQRFLKVWVTERNKCAPNLNNLVIQLIPSNKNNIVGINKFIQYYNSIEAATNTSLIIGS